MPMWALPPLARHCMKSFGQYSIMLCARAGSNTEFLYIGFRFLHHHAVLDQIFIHHAVLNQFFIHHDLLVFVCSCARVSVFLFCMCVFVRARLCIWYLYFVGVIFRWGPTRRVNPRDVTPIVQSRPARKGNKRTQTDKGTTISQKRNPVDFFFPFRELAWPNHAHSPTQSSWFTRRNMLGYPSVRHSNPKPLQL